MTGLQFDEATHTYTYNGVEVPSVTTILRFITAEGFMRVNASVLDAAAERGRAVHAGCEMLDYGCDPELIPGIEPYLKAYNVFLRDYSPEWSGIEYPVVSHDKTYAGTIDRWGFIDDSPCVVDIKTIASPTRGTYISLCAQTSAYAYALGYAEGCKRYGLFLKPNGDYRLFDCEEWEMKNGFAGYGVFVKCQALHDTLAKIEKHKRRKNADSSDPAETAKP